MLRRRLRHRVHGQGLRAHLAHAPSGRGLAHDVVAKSGSGEGAAAIVVAAEGVTPTPEDQTSYLRTERRIAPHTLPERLVLVDALPMTATGKVQKFRLREPARDAAS